MENCPFCHFEDHSVKIFEDALCYAVISKNPINKHHILLIPKEHYQNFVDLPDNLAAHLFLVAKRLSLALRKACNPEAIHHISDDDVANKGYNLVSHYKFHLIPRSEDDGTTMNWGRVNASEEERARYAEDIKKQLT